MRGPSTITAPVPDAPESSEVDETDDTALDRVGEYEAVGPARRWPALATLLVVLVEGVVLAVAARGTGSAVLFAEAAQSFAGAAVEVFLLVGVRRARRAPDEAHPMGHGREAFFWSLIASVGVFVGGGVVSIYYGLQAFQRPGGGEDYLLGYIVLSVIVVADAITLHVALRPLLRSASVGLMGFWRGLRRTSDAGARTLIFDNAAAVVGSVIGIAGLAVHQVTGDARADAAASLVIGMLLLATTVLLLQANRELLTDRTIAPEMVASMRDRIAAQDGVEAVPDLVVVFTGPQAVLVTGTVQLERHLDVNGVERALEDAGAALTRRWPGELRVYLSPIPPEDATPARKDEKCA